MEGHAQYIQNHYGPQLRSKSHVHGKKRSIHKTIVIKRVCS